jgi:hypothetical protein
VGASVGVALAVGVGLDGIVVAVEVGSDPNCSLQAESAASIHSAATTLKIIECDLSGLVLIGDVILFCRIGDFHGYSTQIYFTQFGVGQADR